MIRAGGRFAAPLISDVFNFMSFPGGSMTQTTHTVWDTQATMGVVADALLNRSDVLVHARPGNGGTSFLRSFAQYAPSCDRHFRQINISYHRAIRDDQRHNPLSHCAGNADLILLDDFSCGYNRKGPFKTHGKQLIAFTGTEFTEVALSQWRENFTRPEPDLIVKILTHGQFIVTKRIRSLHSPVSSQVAMRPVSDGTSGMAAQSPNPEHGVNGGRSYV